LTGHWEVNSAGMYQGQENQSADTAWSWNTQFDKLKYSTRQVDILNSILFGWMVFFFQLHTSVAGYFPALFSKSFFYHEGSFCPNVPFERNAQIHAQCNGISSWFFFPKFFCIAHQWFVIVWFACLFMEGDLSVWMKFIIFGERFSCQCVLNTNTCTAVTYMYFKHCMLNVT